MLGGSNPVPATEAPIGKCRWELSFCLLFVLKPSVDAGLLAMEGVPPCATMSHRVPGYPAQSGTKIGTKIFLEKAGRLGK